MARATARSLRLLEFLGGRTGWFSLPRRLTIRLTLEPGGEGGTRLLIHGKAPLLVRRGFANLARLPQRRYSG